MTTLFTSDAINYVNHLVGQHNYTLEIPLQTEYSTIFNKCHGRIVDSYIQTVLNEINRDISKTKYEILTINYATDTEVSSAVIVVNKMIMNAKISIVIYIICADNVVKNLAGILMAFVFFCIKRNSGSFNQLCALEVAKYYKNMQAYCFYSKMGFKEDTSLVKIPYLFNLLPMKIVLTAVDDELIEAFFINPSNDNRIEPTKCFFNNLTDIENLDRYQVLLNNRLLLTIIDECKSVKYVITNYIPQYIVSFIFFRYFDVVDYLIYTIVNDEATTAIYDANDKMYDIIQSRKFFNPNLKTFFNNVIVNLTNQSKTGELTTKLNAITYEINQLTSSRGGGKRTLKRRKTKRKSINCRKPKRRN